MQRLRRAGFVVVWSVMQRPKIVVDWTCAGLSQRGMTRRGKWATAATRKGGGAQAGKYQDRNRKKKAGGLGS